jgi:hypothetical protein
VFDDFRFAYDSYRTGDSITEGSGHGKARNLLVLQPYSIRTHLLAILITVGLKPASVLDNTFGFTGKICFVID